MALFRWIGFFLYPYWKTFSWFLAFRVVRYTILMMVPFMIGYTINAFESGMAAEEPRKLAIVLGGFIVACTLGVYQQWLSTGTFATIFFMAHAL